MGRPVLTEQDFEVVHRERYGTDPLTPHQLLHMMMEAIADLDEAQRVYEKAAHEEADAEYVYRVKRMDIYKRVMQEKTDGTVDFKNALVDGEAATFRTIRDHASYKAKAALENIRNRRQILSAMQSGSNAMKEEIALARTGPVSDGI